MLRLLTTSRLIRHINGFCPDRIQRFSSSLLRSQTDDGEDTIYALSSGSAPQATAVAVIRLSGPHAGNVLQQISIPKLPRPRHATLRTLRYENEVLDQALVLYFPAPHSFTGEEMVELQVHGSRAVVRGLLETLSQIENCRMAAAGEFTQRAFGNGKLDALQVEGLADLLTADTFKQRRLALAQLEGQASRIYEEWREELIRGLAHGEFIVAEARNSTFFLLS